MRRLILHKLHPKSSIHAVSYTTSVFTPQRADPNPNPFPDHPTAAYYDDLVNAAGRDQDFDKLHYLLNKRARDHCLNTANTFKFIDNTPASISVIDDVVRVLLRLDNGFPRKSAYESLVARLSRLYLVDHALKTLEFMAREGCELGASSFHPILNVLSRKKKNEEAWGVMEKMQGLGISPDLTAFNYLLTAQCVAGRLTEAMKVMEMIWEKGLAADSRTYDALVVGACRVGKVEGALMVIRRMVEDGVMVLYSTYAHVINALLGLRYYEQALKFVIIFSGREKGLDDLNFGILGSKLINLKKFDEARSVLEEMEKRGLAMEDKLRDFYNREVRKA